MSWLAAIRSEPVRLDFGSCVVHVSRPTVEDVLTRSLLSDGDPSEALFMARLFVRHARSESGDRIPWTPEEVLRSVDAAVVLGVATRAIELYEEASRPPKPLAS